MKVVAIEKYIYIIQNNKVKHGHQFRVQIYNSVTIVYRSQTAN